MDSWRLEVGVLNMGPQIKMSEIAQSMEWYCISCLLNMGLMSLTHLVTPKLCNIMLYGCAYQDLQCPKKFFMKQKTFHKLVHFQLIRWGGLASLALIIVMD